LHGVSCRIIIIFALDDYFQPFHGDLLARLPMPSLLDFTVGALAEQPRLEDILGRPFGRHVVVEVVVVVL